MRASNRLLTDVDRNWATSRGEEKKRAPWRGYDKRSGFGSYLDTPRKDEHRSDTLTFPSTTIDNISFYDLVHFSFVIYIVANAEFRSAFGTQSDPRLKCKIGSFPNCQFQASLQVEESHSPVFKFRSYNTF